MELFKFVLQMVGALLLGLCLAAVTSIVRAAPLCEAIGGSKYHAKGFDERTEAWQAHLVFGEREVDEDGHDIYPLLSDGDDPRHATWLRYHMGQACDEGMTWGQCARAMLAPMTLATCDGLGPDGACHVLAGTVHKAVDGMLLPPCIFAFHEESGGNEHVSIIHMSPDAGTGSAHGLWFKSLGRRVLDSPTGTWTMTRHD